VAADAFALASRLVRGALRGAGELDEVCLDLNPGSGT
jgi:hypothetical protein